MLHGQTDAGFIQIKSDHAAPGGAQQLDRDLANESNAEHANGFAKPYICPANPLKRYRADSDEGRIHVRHAARNLHNQRRWNRNDFGVIGQARARARNAVADSKIDDVPSHRDHAPRARVAERLPLIELVSHQHQRLFETAHADGVQNFGHFLRPFFRLGQQ